MGQRRVAWFFASILLTVVVAYVSLVLAPYYLNGIFHQPEGQITGQALDPKGYPPFVGAYDGGANGSYLLAIALTTAVLFPLIAPFASIGVVTSWYTYFQKSSRLEKIVLSTLVVIAGVLFLGAITVNNLIPIWLAD